MWGMCSPERNISVLYTSTFRKWNLDVAVICLTSPPCSSCTCWSYRHGTQIQMSPQLFSRTCGPMPSSLLSGTWTSVLLISSPTTWKLPMTSLDWVVINIPHTAVPFTYWLCWQQSSWLIKWVSVNLETHSLANQEPRGIPNGACSMETHIITFIILVSSILCPYIGGILYRVVDYSVLVN